MRHVANRSALHLIRGAYLGTGGIAVAGLCAFALRTVLARALGPSEFGAFASALVIFGTMQQLVLWGLESALPIRIARELSGSLPVETRGIVEAGVVVAGVLGGIGGASLWAGAEAVTKLTIRDPRMGELLRAFAIAMPFTTIHAALASALAGYKRIGWMVVSLRFAGNAGALAIILVFLRLNVALGTLPFAFVLSSLLGMAIACVGLPAKFSSPLGRGLDQIVGLFRDTALLGVANVLGALQDRVDVITLLALATPKEVGLYVAAKGFLPVLNMVFNGFGAIILPEQAQAFQAGDDERILRTFHTWLRWGVAISVPLIVIVWGEGGLIVELLLGSNYRGSERPLQILASGLFISLVAGHWRHMARASARTKIEVMLIGAGLLATGLFAAILIPRLGIVGGAIAYAACFSVVNCVGLAVTTGLRGYALLLTELPTVAVPAIGLYVVVLTVARRILGGQLSNKEVLVAVVVYLGCHVAWMVWQNVRRSISAT